MSKLKVHKKYSSLCLGNPKVKAIIIGTAGLMVLLLGIFAFVAIKSNDDNRIAALRYRFNQYYPGTFNHMESPDNASELTDVISKLNMSMIDSDNDGISDEIEKMVGLNPNSGKSDNVTLDSEKIFTRDIDFGEGIVTLTGNANIYGATVDKLSLNAVRSNAGVLSAPYELYCKDGFDSAEIKFKYDDEKLRMTGAGKDNIHIYRFDPYSKDYTNMGGKLSFADRTVNCDITENCVFLLGADNIIDKSAVAYASEKFNVHLIIDNSGSLYPSTDTYNSEENDVNFKRIAFAKKFVNEFDNDARFAISVFTYEFKTLCDFDSNKEKTINAIESIRTMGAGFDGTSVERAMVLGLDSFKDDTVDQRNIIILLTDGISTNSAGYTMQSILTRAKSKNVTVMTISLGDSYDRELLETIANNTGGQYYQISEANLLENLHARMMISMNDDIVDEDNDGEVDSYTLFDTGFVADTNGYSFDNFKLKTGESADLAMTSFARDWFWSHIFNAVYYDLDDVDTDKPLRKYAMLSMNSSYMKPDEYLDFSSPSGVLKVKKEIRDEALSKGWTIIEIDYDEPAGVWKKAEILVPDGNSDAFGSAYGQVERDMIQSIEKYDSSVLSGGFKLMSDASLDRVKSTLISGRPIVTKISWTEDGKYLSRYVLLTVLRRDLDDPNLFRLKVYDVNTRGPAEILLNRIMVDNSVMYVGEWSGKYVTLECY